MSLLFMQTVSSNIALQLYIFKPSEGEGLCVFKGQVSHTKANENALVL